MKSFHSEQILLNMGKTEVEFVTLGYMDLFNAIMKFPQSKSLSFILHFLKCLNNVFSLYYLLQNTHLIQV